jgi:hypothetical protein
MTRPFKSMRNSMDKIKKKSPTQKKQQNHSHLKSSRYVIYIIIYNQNGERYNGL